MSSSLPTCTEQLLFSGFQASSACFCQQWVDGKDLP